MGGYLKTIKSKKMKIELKTTQEYDIKTLLVECNPRYWEDSIINGTQDTEEGTLIPCKNGDEWMLRIDVENGKILNWPQGINANIHYKVCDMGTYTLFDSLERPIVIHENTYVPRCLCPKENGYGDYIIMDITIDGFILGWDSSSIQNSFSEE